MTGRQTDAYHPADAVYDVWLRCIGRESERTGERIKDCWTGEARFLFVETTKGRVIRFEATEVTTHALAAD